MNEKELSLLKVHLVNYEKFFEDLVDGQIISTLLWFAYDKKLNFRQNETIKNFKLSLQNLKNNFSLNVDFVKMENKIKEFYLKYLNELNVKYELNLSLESFDEINTLIKDLNLMENDNNGYNYDASLLRFDYETIIYFYLNLSSRIIGTSIDEIETTCREAITEEIEDLIKEIF